MDMDNQQQQQQNLVRIRCSNMQSVAFTRDQVERSPYLRRLLNDVEVRGDAINNPVIMLQDVDFAELNAINVWINMLLNAGGERPGKERIDAFLMQHKTTIVKLFVVAVLLELPILSDILASEVAKKLDGKTPSEVRQFFAIDNDLTLEQEQFITAENEALEIYKPLR